MTLPKRPGFYSTPTASEYETALEEVAPKEEKVVFEEYTVLLELGRGSFGRVFQALLEPQGILCAVKQITLLPGEKGQKVLAEAEKEIRILSFLRHPNVVNMFGSTRTPDFLNIFMQLVTGNSLDVIKKIRKSQGATGFSESIIASYIKQTLSGLIYCHKRGVIHRDLKGKNILLDSGGLIKIADFGSGKIVDAKEATELTASNTFNYTILWVAPEVVTGKSIYDRKCDIWSLGCVAIELASLDDPWHERKFTKAKEVVDVLCKPDQFPAVPPGYSDEFYDFIRKCLTRDVDERPEAKELWDHAWFKRFEEKTELVSEEPKPLVRSEVPSAREMEKRKKEKLLTDRLTGRGERARPAR